MTGREFIAELERHGFLIRRRSRSFVWVARGEQTVMLDEEASVPETYLARILGSRSRPPSSGRVPISARPSVLPSSARPSAHPSGRPSGRPSKSP